MKKINIFRMSLFLALLGFVMTLRAEDPKKVLVMGDSMAGWMGDRFNAYGQSNGFDVATIVWDGSTFKKWGASTQSISTKVNEYDPDLVIICLGLNESAEQRPETQLGKDFKNIIDAVGEREIVWVGPPSWPGKPYGEPLNGWLASKMGEGHYFESLGLNLPRQSATNPHPSKEGMRIWTDKIIEWLPENVSVKLPLSADPAVEFSRSKNFLYKKMKEQL